jgi:hypothetical protein
MYAASFSASAMNAARKGENQPWRNTPQIPGSASQTNSSCSSVGVARKIQV